MRVAGLMDAATSVDDAERTKPNPDIFPVALAKLKVVMPGEAVVVADSPYDAEAAAKQGTPAIGVLCGGFPEQALRAVGCAAFYRDPADMLRDYAALAELAGRRAA